MGIGRSMIPRAKSGPKPKSRRPRRPPTEPSRLGLVPLFRPGEGFGPDDPSDAVPSKDERARIRSILSKALENTCGKHDIEIFFGRAIPAITTYMWNCDQKPNFDQAKAKKLIAGRPVGLFLIMPSDRCKHSRRSWNLATRPRPDGNKACGMNSPTGLRRRLPTR
jgi:hypothetical protein